MENKRKEKRFEENNTVMLRFMHEDHEENSSAGIKALTRDISLGGARIIAPKSYPVDTMMRIEIALSKSEQVVRVDGIVRWVECSPDDVTYELGIEFLHKISKSVLALIQHLYGEDKSIPSTIS